MADLIITVARAEDLDPTEREIERRGLKVVATLSSLRIILACGDMGALEGIAGIDIREDEGFHTLDDG